MNLRVGIENPPQLTDAVRSEDVGMFGFNGIQDPVNVEEEDVKQHDRESTACVKRI